MKLVEEQSKAKEEFLVGQKRLEQEMRQMSLELCGNSAATLRRRRIIDELSTNYLHLPALMILFPCFTTNYLHLPALVILFPWRYLEDYWRIIEGLLEDY